MAQICKLLAPWAPFMTDNLWRDLMKNTNEPSSVHLCDWPQKADIDNEIIKQMQVARDCIVDGLSQRAEAKIKVRQPLQSISISNKITLSEELVGIVKDELNVKTVKFINSDEKVVIDTTMTESLIQEGVSIEIVRLVQESRKKASLNVDNRINLQLKSEDKNINKAINEFLSYINLETLATGNVVKKPIYDELIKIGEKTLRVRIERAD
jgi:isoleucyl-tRNA synthetase